MNLFPQLRTHLFSFPLLENVDRNTDLKDFEFMIGNTETQKDCVQILTKFLKGGSIHQGCMIIRGTMGVGKSLLLRKILYKVHDKI